MPALAVVGDGALGAGAIGDGAGGKQAPVDGGLGIGWADLARIEDEDLDLLGDVAILVRGLFQDDAIEAYLHGHQPRATSGLGWHVEDEFIGGIETVEMGVEGGAGDQTAICLRAHQQFDLGWSAGEGGEDVAFAIGDDGDAARAGGT